MIRVHDTQISALREQLDRFKHHGKVELSQGASGTLSLSTRSDSTKPYFRCYIRRDGRVSEAT